MATKGAVYARGNVLWLWYRNAAGKRIYESTGLRVGEERQAEKLLAKVLRSIEAGVELGLDTQTATVRAWAAEWIRRRHARGIRTAGDDEARMRDHVLPALGDVRLADLRPKRVRAWVHALRAGELAPRTVRHVYSTLRACMTEAVVEELIMATPCVLLPGDLPEKRDADPTWRSGAVFRLDEIERVISSEELPEDRRVVYALLGLAGLRWGEMAALRWRDYDAGAQPLGCLTIATSYSTRRKSIGETKTGAVRHVPVHPVLAAILASWRLGGWLELGGHKPRPDDLVIPSRLGDSRSVSHGRKRLIEDCKRLTMEPRSPHSFRRAFVTAARSAGASPEHARWITHAPPRSAVIDGYTVMEWATLCGVVERIEARLRAPGGAEVIPLAGDSAVTVGAKSTGG